MKTLITLILLIGLTQMTQAQDSETLQQITKNFPELKGVLVDKGQGKIYNRATQKTSYEDEICLEIATQLVIQYKKDRSKAVMIKALTFIGDTGASSEMYFDSLETLLKTDPQAVINATQKIPKSAKEGIKAQFQGLQGLYGVKVPTELL